jgi:non-specific serine/threonine protein kinase
VLAGLAGVAYAEGEAEHAVRLLGAVGRLTEIIKGSKLESVNQTIHDHNLAAARAQLDETTFNAAWGAGRQMTLDDAIAYALEETTR